MVVLERAGGTAMDLPNDILIGLDAGIAQVTAVAFAPDGRELARSSAAGEIHHLADGRIEQEPGDAWHAAAAAVRGLAARLPDLAARAAGIAITGATGGTWLIDDDGDPVARAWLPGDRRAAPLVDQWQRAGIGHSVRAITGMCPRPCSPTAQLATLVEHGPALLDRAATALQGKDWLYFCCTEERATDPASAASAFGDWRVGGYDARVLELLDLQDIARLLPDLVQDGHGDLAPAAAAAFGLAAGTPVVLGPADLIAVAIAAGLAADNRIACTILDGGGTYLRAGGRLPDLERRLGAIDAIVPYAGTWFQVMHGPGTVTASWLVEVAVQLLADAGLIGISRGDLIAVLEQRAAAAAPGAVRFDPGDPGTAAESPVTPARFTGISAATTFYDLLRSLHESHAAAARAGYVALGSPPAELRVAGDGATSALARQVLAAHVDAPVRLLQRPAATGAALIGAVALGHYGTLEAAARDWVEPHLGPLEPVDRDLRERYAQHFPVAPGVLRDRVA